MDAKKYLEQLKTIDRKINQLYREKERMEAQLSPGSTAPKEVQVLSSVPADPMGDKVAAIVDIEREMDRLSDQLIKKRSEILNVIHSLDDSNCIDLLYKRYMEYKQWKDVEKEMNYSHKQTMRIHGRALSLVRKKVEKMKDDTK